uniref:Peptidyl-prolyl cis-trans isomerase n=1 Tax=Ditylenchus dipsaci TaxID=166011 RepID=A0A915CQL1_9BILA
MSASNEEAVSSKKRKTETEEGEEDELPKGWEKRMSRISGIARRRTRVRRRKFLTRFNVCIFSSSMRDLVDRHHGGLKTSRVPKKEARATLEGYEKELSHMDEAARRSKFRKIAAEFSDCNSAKRGGDLGAFEKRQMQKPFEDAAFALKIGQMSEITETDSGLHLILRIA